LDRIGCAGKRMASDSKVAETEEDAQKLKLGADFEEARCLWNAEVAIILEHHGREREANESETVSSTTNASAMIQSTLSYARRFQHYNNREALADARRLSDRLRLHAFESAVLNNLNVEAADEAITLVPTLKERFQPDDKLLEKYLNDIKRLMSS